MADHFGMNEWILLNFTQVLFLQRLLTPRILVSPTRGKQRIFRKRTEIDLSLNSTKVITLHFDIFFNRFPALLSSDTKISAYAFAQSAITASAILWESPLCLVNITLCYGTSAARRNSHKELARDERP